MSDIIIEINIESAFLELLKNNKILILSNKNNEEKVGLKILDYKNINNEEINNLKNTAFIYVYKK